MEPFANERPRFRYAIQTMGCKANVFDSMVLEGQLAEMGGTRAIPGESPDLILLNSCTVTAEADRQAMNDMARARRKAPKALTVMTGCLAEVAPERVKGEGSSDLVVSNSEKNRIKALVAEKLGLPFPTQGEASADEVFWGQLPATGSGRTRSFLKIQEGCNDYCTYCIIPYARGKSRSVRFGSIIAEVNRLVAAGTKEIVLTGTNIADYGIDLGSSLDALIEGILRETDLPRLRLSSLDPTEVTPIMLSLMTERASRLMPHLHVSLQSPVTRVLRAMKRGYDQQMVAACLEAIHSANPSIYVGMDIIAGFPSETEDEHQEGADLLARLPWTRLHVFPYSPRQGTPATRIKGMAPTHVRKRRAQELLALSHARHGSHARSLIGNTLHDVLLETPHQNGLDAVVTGYSPAYARVMVPVKGGMVQALEFMNQRVTVLVTGAVPQPAQDWTLEGIISASR